MRFALIIFPLVAEDCLEERTFLTRVWYSKHQDIITPAGLAFFQSDWDTCLTDFYHKNLNMKEPSMYSLEFFTLIMYIAE